MRNFQQNAGVFMNIKKFLESESAGGILLFICAILAMFCANFSPIKEIYFKLWEMPFGISFNDIFIGFSLQHWLNDVFMAFFFLVVGLEIKREFLFGELVGFKRAAFPVFAALGGMIVPGIIYYSFNVGSPSEHGFGIPMATDIAFALGVMMILGKRVPVALKVFLVTLAVADDMGAIIVIGMFYTSDFNILWFLISLGVIASLVVINKLHITSLVPYILLGICLWFTVHNSGIHATIAAVALSFCIPVRQSIDVKEYLKNVTNFPSIFLQKERERENILLTGDQISLIDELERETKRVQNPLLRLEHRLSKISTLIIMPLFGFANAGVDLSGDISFNIDGIMYGIILGLVVGKPIGITLFTFICHSLKFAKKPDSITWINIWGAGMVAGIGFTMSIFVSNLAFTTQASTNLSKVSILIASSLACILGSTFLVIYSNIKKTDEQQNKHINKGNH